MPDIAKKIFLKAGREKSLKRRHPWVFSGAIGRLTGDPQAGDTVHVMSAEGLFLGVAAFSPQSQIAARVYAWEPQDIGPPFFRQTIARAYATRKALLDSGRTNAVRLLHAESDGLPGVIADLYDHTVVVQLLTTGAQRWREDIFDVFMGLPGVTGVWERSDADVRALEGLQPQVGLVRGIAPGEPLLIHEDGLQFEVSLKDGHKTGYYLDQRDNHWALRQWVKDKQVLDCFCYSGGFALNALKGGASTVVGVDSSGPALWVAKANAQRNGFAATAVEWLEADVFQALRKFRDQGRHFDVVVLDPPKLAPTAAHAEKAARAYKDINLMAFKLLNPGGRLLTYSCSGGISAELFQKIVAGAALDAGVQVRIQAWHHAAFDHPVVLHFPEGEYLTGLVCELSGGGEG